MINADVGPKKGDRVGFLYSLYVSKLEQRDKWWTADVGWYCRICTKIFDKYGL